VRGALAGSVAAGWLSADGTSPSANFSALTPLEQGLALQTMVFPPVAYVHGVSDDAAQMRSWNQTMPATGDASLHAVNVLLQSAAESGSACDGGHAGESCARCVRGHGKNPAGECLPCQDHSLHIMGVIGAIFLLWFGTAVLTFINIGGRAALAAADGSGVAKKKKKESKALPVIRVVISFFQIIGMTSTYRLNWSTQLKSLFSFFDAASLTSASVFSSDCLWDADPARVG